VSSPSQVTTLPVAAADVPELVFPTGLPGFPGERRFALVRWGAFEGPYSLMVDLGNPDVRFLVMPPYVFFPDYVVDLDDSIAAKIHLDKAENCLLLHRRLTPRTSCWKPRKEHHHARPDPP
jgi:flagellar assembly factor FliW